MFEEPYPVSIRAPLGALAYNTKLKMLAPIVHIQATKGARVVKLDMALQTCCKKTIQSGAMIP